MRIYDHVMRMFNMGFSITPPLVPNGPKGQTIEEWKPYQTERATPQQLAKWYLPGNGRYNRYGIITGAVSGIVVLDSDDTPAEQFVNDHCPPSPVRSRSGSGRGLHHVYQHPGFHIQNVTKLNGFNLDVRGDGGLIVGPGSVHSSGGIYKELAPWSVPALKACPVFDPSWLGLERVKKVAPVSSLQARPDVPYTTKQALAAEWLRGKKGAIGGDPEKPGEPYCLALAVALTWGFDLSAEEALPVFLVWGEREDQRHTDGTYYPWTETQLIHKLRSAETKEDREGRPKGYRIGSATTASIRTNEDRLRLLTNEAKPRKTDVIIEQRNEDGLEDNETVSPVLTPPIESNIPVAKLEHRVPNVLHYIGRGKDSYDWAIPGRLRQGVLAIMGGDAKTGKTTLVYNTALDMILEHSAWGVQCEPIPVIHLDYETDPTFIRNNIFAPRNLTKEQEEEVGRYLFATDGLDPEPLNCLPPYITTDYLDQIIKSHEKPGIIIPDTFRGAFTFMPGLKPGWDFQADEVRRLLSPFLHWCHRTNWTILMLAHNNKGGGLYGSVDFRGVADQLLSLTRELDHKGRPTTVARVKIEGRLPAPPDMRFEFLNNLYHYAGTDAEKDGLDKDKKTRGIQDQIVKLCQETGKITLTQCRTKIPGDNNTVDEVFNNLITESGVLVALPGYNKGYELAKDYLIRLNA